MSAAVDTQEHNRLITDQFTRQAIPFAQLHSDDDSVQKLIAETGVTGTDRVLDVACGPGLVACGFAAVAGHVTGIDLTPAMIEQAERLQAARGLSNVAWRVGDVATLPFADGEFSAVVSRYAMHHILDPARVIAEMARVCAAGGRVVVADVFMESVEQGAAYDAMEKLRDPSHARAMLLGELHASFASAGLGQIKRQFYRFDVEVDHLLKATCTPPDAAEKFRRTVSDDVGQDRLGIQARWAGDVLGFSFPVVMISGCRPVAVS